MWHKTLLKPLVLQHVHGKCRIGFNAIRNLLQKLAQQTGDTRGSRKQSRKPLVYLALRERGTRHPRGSLIEAKSKQVPLYDSRRHLAELEILKSSLPSWI